MEKVYFTEKEVVEKFLEILNSGDLEDGALYSYDYLLFEAFGTSYYIPDFDEAELALKQYGKEKAKQKVEEFEIKNFGEVVTDFEDVVSFADMLFYIVGDKVIENVVSISEYEECTQNQFLELFKNI